MKRPLIAHIDEPDHVTSDVHVAALLEDVEQEQVPERLLQLARKLQERLQERNSHSNPN